MRSFLIIKLLPILLLLAGCSGDSDSGVDEEYNPDFSVLKPILDDVEVADMTVLIGNHNGVLYSYEKGNLTADTSILIASANKWLTGATIWRLIEKGVLSKDDHPQQYIDFWTDDVNDPRSRVTLDMLLGLTSGFNNSPTELECINDPAYTLAECVEILYDGGVDSEPGAFYAYGPEHFQIAALMATEAMAGMGNNFQALMREELFTPLEMSEATGYALTENENARYSGSIHSTANDYGLFLRALLAGELISDVDGFVADRTASATFSHRPDGIEANNLDWHYAFGFWIECDAVPYESYCNYEPTISSPGAFGFTPWIDFENGYWGVIAIQEGRDDPDFNPSMLSVALEQEIQPLIEEILGPE